MVEKRAGERRAVRFPWGAAGVAALLALLLGLGWWAGETRARGVDAAMREQLLLRAADVASAVEPALVRQLSFTAADRSAPAFDRLREQMVAAGRAFPHRGLYSLARRGGRLVFGPEDYPPGDPMASAPGTAYATPAADTFRVFEEKRPLAAGPFTDEYGTLVSALAPVLDPGTGEVLMVVGVDVMAHEWEARLEAARREALQGTLASVLVLALGAVALRLYNRRARQGGVRFKAWILAPTALAMASGLALSVAYEYRDFRADESREALRTAEQARREWTRQVASEAALLRTQVDRVLGDAAILEAWQARDLARLTALAQPLLAQLKRDHGISLLYFISPDRTCFLRAYDPEHRGDRIDRATLLAAQRTGEDAWGMELGSLEAYSLRYVKPWKRSGVTHGYVEAGVGVEHLVDWTARATGFDGITVLRKEYLARERFESGRAVLGPHGEWDAYPDLVVVQQTRTLLPNEVTEWLGRRHGSREARASFSASLDGRTLACSVIDLPDAAGRDVAQLVVMRDVTSSATAGTSAVLLNLGFAVMLFGGLLALLWSVTGHTEQRLAASFRQVQQSESRFRRMFDESPLGAAMVSLDLCYLVVNESLCRMTGYSAEELTRRSVADLTHPEDLAADKEGTARLLAGTIDHFEADKRYLRRDGGVAWIHLNVRLVRDEQGRPLYLLPTMEDITARRTAEQALRESEGRVRAKLDAILSPTGDLGALELGDILDVTAVQRIMDEFHALTKMTVALLDLRGNVLVASGWQDVCTGFHRAHPEAARHCLESDTVLTQGVEPGTSRTYRCGNHLRDVATPIVVAGKQLGNLYLGQFLFVDEPFDVATFRDQARRFGFDEQAYLAACERVPRWSREQVDAAMAFLMRLADMIASLSHGNIRLARTLTERDRLVESLRESEEKFKAIANYTVEWESWFAPDGKLLWLNPAVERITGYSVEELLAHPDFVSLLVDEEDRGPFPGLFRDALRGERHGEFEFRARHKDGTLIWLSASWQPIYDAGGRFLGIRASCRDVSARKRTEEALERRTAQLFQSQKMEAVGRLAGGLAHDFNNVLQALLSLATSLRLRVDSPELAKTVEEIEAHVRRGASLTQQLLLFSRREIARSEPVELGSLAAATVSLLRRLIPENVRIEVETTPEPVWVEGDTGQLEQVLMNLAINGKDAMPDGGTLHVRTGRLRDEAVLEVHDTGHGMDAATRARIFEPFFTTKGTGKGTGLGLSVVHGIVEHHGGRVEVESAPGAGSLFRVVLPATAAPLPGDVRPPDGPSGMPLGHGERVLVVEDEAGAREGMTDVLEMLGYRVTAARSGEDARALPVEPAPELLLTDLVLPGITGAELAASLQRRWPDMRVILMSGYTADEQVRHDVEIGQVRFLQKPFGMSELACELRSALGAGG